MPTRLILSLICCVVAALSSAAPKPSPKPTTDACHLSCLVGRPTDRSVALNLRSDSTADVYVEYGPQSGRYSKHTTTITVSPEAGSDCEITGLEPDHLYYYRLRSKDAERSEFGASQESSFRTQRRAGETFTFCVQGDSHPERPGRMYDDDLYRRTLSNVVADKPDFYFLMGDDFSIERLIERNEKSQGSVDAIYANQRNFLDKVGRSTPLMLVNGNHEQAAKYLLDGTPDNFAVLAGNARTNFFPLPAPDEFYSGNKTPVPHVGLLRDYYAWEWGDALFVVIDPYWHSDAPVDNEAGVRAPAKDTPQGPRRAKGKVPNDPDNAQAAGRAQRDLWQITLGDEQYKWLRETLSRSKAPFKFVFSHHVLGTGRGGIEQATKFEWGGDDRRGIDRFFTMRPNWEKPIHDLMRDTGVTIFFQGHDHLYARQELDGVIYQTCPNPADPTFTAFNRQAYTAGDIFPNSGHLRITIEGGKAPQCRVQYVRSLRPSDETDALKNNTIVHEYTARPRRPDLPPVPKDAMP